MRVSVLLPAALPVAVCLILSLTARVTSAQCNDCWLEVRGKEIVNASTGQPVILRAVGLGNWLLQEGYMLNPGGCEGCPGTQWQMKRQYLNEGQSIGQVEAFYAAWRDRFITKADIDYIASLGFNSVRLPMHYELFLTTEQRAVRNAVITNLPVGHDAYKAALRQWVDNGELFVDPQADGFKMIDRLIVWCEANGMYVILDLHAAPGAQGSDLNIADGFYANNLWQFPVFQDVTNQLWLSISNRYKAEPRIAMYEFINEPNNVPGGGQAIHALTQRLLTTVRNNGDNHIIGIHGNGWGNNYDFMEPNTFTPNWGLVYSAHRYWIDPADDWIPDPNPNQINRMANLIAFRETHNVPVWVGETGENNNAWLSQNIAKLEDAGIGWCHWTYKRHDWQQNAALARLGGNYPTDGASAMGTVLNAIRFANIIPNTNTIAAVTGMLPPAGSTGCRADPNLCAPIGSRVTIRGNNALYVSAAGEQSILTCTVSESGLNERFEVVDAGSGWVALRGANGRYVSSQNGQSPMACNSEAIGDLERFEWLDLGNGTFALRGSNGLFVSSENGTQPMRCDRPLAQAWEGFTFELIELCLGDIADEFGTLGGDGQVSFGDFLALLGLIGPCP
jgi:endoglucanase